MPVVGGPAAASALERERLGDDANGQDALVAGALAMTGSGAGAGAAAHARGDEAHVRPFARRSRRASLRRRHDRSRAAILPPSPWVILRPSWIRRSAVEALSAWASVLATMKSTPWTSARIMLAMAFPPAPPTPITLIRGRKLVDLPAGRNRCS